MNLKIISSFVEVGSPAFRTNDVLEVPANIALQWIHLRRAVSLEPSPSPETPDTTVPAAKREKAIRPKG
jgi:hypothetical protein